MKAVGLRELKNRLSEYVRMVRNGETVLVSDRGAVVAELRPPGTNAAASDPVTESLARHGNVTVGAPNRADLYPSLTEIVLPGTAQRLLDEERADR
jgi:antitoxin (DNA-binding transcriptional repressor) of toxin-antitoxin stability system